MLKFRKHAKDENKWRIWSNAPSKYQHGQMNSRSGCLFSLYFLVPLQRHKSPKKKKKESWWRQSIDCKRIDPSWWSLKNNTLTSHHQDYKWRECKIVQMITMMITMFFDPHHCIILMMVTITKRTPVWVTVAVAWWERLKWLVTTFQGIFLAGDHFPRYWLSFTKKFLFQSCFWQGTTYSQARSCQLLFFNSTTLKPFAQVAHCLYRTQVSTHRCR